MVELIVNGKSVELERKGGEIRYNIQISDIFDMARVASSYTTAFTIPKTPFNTQVFQQLGIAGDTSSLPYEKVPVKLNSNGFPIIVNGWLDILRTDREGYRVNIVNGMIDFFKAIENKTMGVDLDLTPFNHEKTIDTVIGSFTNEYYRYLVADYNGKNIGILPDETSGINIDYLVPCFSVQKLWDLIFTTFGFEYNVIPLQPFFQDLYITYPTPPEESNEPEIVGEASKGQYISYNNGYTFLDYQGYKYTPNNEFWDNVEEGEFGNNWVYTIPESGSYTFEITTDAFVYYERRYMSVNFGWQNEGTIKRAIMALVVNGIIVETILSGGSTNPSTLALTDYFNEGDTIEFKLLMNPTAEAYGNTYNLRYINHTSTEFKVYGLNLGDVSLTNAFEDFSIKDFIKETLWRTGLTPVIDKYTNYIDFIKISDRLNFDNAIDWSDKYIDREDEAYEISTLAQKNVFALKHNNEPDLRGNGYLYANNKTLQDEKTIASSKLFAPEPLGFAFMSVGESASFQSDVYRVWNREVKPDGTGGVAIDYKGLNNRFYFVRGKTVSAEGSDNFRLVSETLLTTNEVEQLHFATSNQTLFEELVFQNYAEYKGVLYNLRLHNIQLVLTERDIIELDMTKPYYFKQEGQYYMLNKLSYQEGQISKGEFVRINKI